MTPAKTTATRNTSKLPRSLITTATIAASPAARPDTFKFEPLKSPTITPHIIPAIKPDKSGAPEANAIPKHKCKATKNITILAGKSFLRFLKFIFLFLFKQEICFLIKTYLSC